MDGSAKSDFVTVFEYGTYENSEHEGYEREDFEYEIEIEFCWFECEYEERAPGGPACEGGEFESAEIKFWWFERECEERGLGGSACGGEFESE